MEKPKIIIVIEGGIIQAVYSSSEVEYSIVDYDNWKGGKQAVLGVFDSDVVECDLKELYNHPENESPKFSTIYEELKRLGF